MIRQPETSSVYANNYMICANSKAEAKKVRRDRDETLDNESIVIEVIGDASSTLEIGVLMFEVEK